MKFLKSKKAFEAADLISWSFFIIILGVAIFLLQLSQVALAQDFEEVSPEITNKLASNYVLTYLNQELTLDEKEDLGLDKNKIYRVEDLHAHVGEEYDQFLYRKKTEYNDFYLDSSIFKNYEGFSENRLPSGSYLEVESLINLNGLEELEEEIIKGNFYVIIVEDNLKSYEVVWFKK